MSDPRRADARVAVIGGGPAGLMAAEVIAAAGVPVDLYDAMPSVGRKFLLAGKGGMNLTHSEDYADFVARYGERAAVLNPMLDAFGPDQLRAWAHGLGVETFVGSSGRVFPVDMKAAPLLRAWLHRLRQNGVRFHMRHRWCGWDDHGTLLFSSDNGEWRCRPAATVLALGGGSWARLGSDGKWVSLLAARGVAVAPLLPANCGFDVNWSEPFRTRSAGEPVKAVIASFTDARGQTWQRQGELVITEHGVEGGLVYAFSAGLRDTIAAFGEVTLWLDLAPGKEQARLAADLARPRGGDSLANHLRKRAGITGVKAGLVREAGTAEQWSDPARLGALIKALPLRLSRPRPIDEAISTAGGVAFEELDANLMVRSSPGLFCAGEMLDWEAPTGGYLLTACFATGRAAGAGVLHWLTRGSGASTEGW